MVNESIGLFSMVCDTCARLQTEKCGEKKGNKWNAINELRRKIDESNEQWVAFFNSKYKVRDTRIVDGWFVSKFFKTEMK